MKKGLSLVACLLILSIGLAQQKVEYTDFLIVENPKEKYEGNYKNGQPFSGYFKAEEYIDNESFIDYYENGEKKFRYYFDYLKGETYHGKYYYDTKTEYENGEIKNGFDIKNKGRALVLTEYEDFKRTKIHLDVFAMHYFNRISFEVKNETLIISEYQGKDWRLEIKKLQNQPYESIIYHKNKVYYSYKSKDRQEINFASPNSITYYHKNKKTNQLDIRTYEIEQDDNEDSQKINELYKSATALGNIFYSFSTNKKDGIEEWFERIYQNMQGLGMEEERGFEALFKDKSTELEVVSYLKHDKNGKIEVGGKVTPNTNGTYRLEVYGKDKKEYPELSLDEIKKIIEEGIVVG